MKRTQNGWPGGRAAAVIRAAHRADLAALGEFFAGLFESRKQTNERKRFAGILKRLQGSLGALNDIEVHSVSP